MAWACGGHQGSRRLEGRGAGLCEQEERSPDSPGKPRGAGAGGGRQHHTRTRHGGGCATSSTEFRGPSTIVMPKSHPPAFQREDSLEQWPRVVASFLRDGRSQDQNKACPMFHPVSTQALHLHGFLFRGLFGRDSENIQRYKVYVCFLFLKENCCFGTEACSSIDRRAGGRPGVMAALTRSVSSRQAC